jgi:hypothetical protein
MKQKQSLLIVLSLLVTSLLACGFSTSGGGGSTPTTVPTEAPAAESPLDTLDPCAVLTQADATAFFGAEAVTGIPSHGTSTATCLYMTADSANTLSLLVEYHPTGGLMSDEYIQMKSSSAKDVPGLGDGAYFDPLVHQLAVAKGVWVVRLSGLVQGSNAPLEKLTPLAQTALGRLP